MNINKINKLLNKYNFFEENSTNLYFKNIFSNYLTLTLFCYIICAICICLWIYIGINNKMSFEWKNILINNNQVKYKFFKFPYWVEINAILILLILFSFSILTYKYIFIWLNKKNVLNDEAAIILIPFYNIYNWFKLTINGYINPIKSFLFIFKKYSKLDNRKSWTYIFSIITLLIMTPMIYFVLIKKNDTFNLPKEVSYQYNNLIFCSFSYFTIQVNIICYFVLLFFILFPNSIIFSRNSIFITTMSWLFLVGAFYSVFILPINIKNNRYDTDIKLVTTIWCHAINPIIFVFFSLIKMKYGPNLNIISTKKLMIYNLIYPFFYSVYLFIILPLFFNISMYGSFSNSNNDLYIINSSNQLSNGSIWKILLILPMSGLIELIAYGYYWFNKYAIYKNCIKLNLH